MVTCIQVNEGSKHTILANGGVYENIIYCEPDDVLNITMDEFQDGWKGFLEERIELMIR